MRFEVEAVVFKSTLKGILALYELNRDDPETSSTGLLTVSSKSLTIEYGRGGSYIKRVVEIKVLREGSVGIDLKTLVKDRMTGTVRVDCEDGKVLKVKSGRTLYKHTTDDTVVDYMDAVRPSKKMVVSAVVPATALRTAVSSTTYKPGLAEQELKVQVEFRRLKKGKKGKMVVAGMDAYAFAQYTILSADVEVKKSVKFIVMSSVLRDVLKELDEGMVRVGVIAGGDEETSLVRFKASGIDFAHPIFTEGAFENVEELSAGVKSVDCGGAFTVPKNTLKTAVDSVKVLGTTADPAMLHIKVQKKKVQMFTFDGNNRATTVVEDVEDIEVGKGGLIMQVNPVYFAEFLKSAPDSVMLRLEAWEDVLRIEGQELKPVTLEYVVTQGDSDDSGD